MSISDTLCGTVKHDALYECVDCTDRSRARGARLTAGYERVASADRDACARVCPRLRRVAPNAPLASKAAAPSKGSANPPISSEGILGFRFPSHRVAMDADAGGGGRDEGSGPRAGQEGTGSVRFGHLLPPIRRGSACGFVFLPGRRAWRRCTRSWRTSAAAVCAKPARSPPR